MTGRPIPHFASEIMQDARHALRLWARCPLQTVFAIAALAIGIGANVGVFSVVNALLLRSLPFRDPDRLVILGFSPPHDSAKQFHDWRRQSEYLDEVAMLDSRDVNLGGLRESARVHSTETSWNFFSMLGTHPIRGRFFAPDEDSTGRGAVAVVGYAVWQQYYGGDPRAVGSTIQISGAPFTVIGIAPPGFDYPENSALWTPTTFDRGPVPKGWNTIARLKSGVTWQQAREAFRAEADRLSTSRRKIDKINHPPRMTPLRDQLVGPAKEASLMLFAGVVLILLIACTNVANLLLARTADRTSELSIRSAIGASRARLTRQLLTESLLLSLVASIAGLLVAFWTTSIAGKVQPAPLAAQSYSLLDARVLTFAITISLFSGLLFGILPSLYAGRAHMIASRGSNTRSGSRLVRETLVAVQVMLTVGLLASSVSIGRAFIDLMGLDRGFALRGLVTASVSLDGTTHVVGDRGLQYFEEAVAKVRQLPEVRNASVTEFVPLLATPFLGAPFSLDGRQAREFSMIVPILPDYFQTMGGHIVYGREFTDAEILADAPVAVINELFAAEFGQPADALGRELRVGTRPPRKIIGIAKGMAFLGDYNPTQVYFPDHSPGHFFTTIIARVNGRAEDHLAMVRDAIKSIDPQVPVYSVETMEQRLAEAMARPRFYSTAVLFFAAFALLLAVIGIYGVVSYAVAQRTHEMGVRMALGSTSGRLRSVLLRQGLVAVAAGTIPGIGGAVLSGRFLASLIDGAKSASVETCAAAVVFITAIAALGIWAATRRIAHLDIMEILRSQ